MRQLPSISVSSLVQAFKDPHDLYDATRRAGGVYFDRTSNSWLVTEHEACKKILGDSRFSSDLPAVKSGTRRSAGISILQAAIEKQILFSDGERHRRVHEVILRESNRKMQEVQPAVRDTARRLLEEVRSDGTLDLVRDFALPYSFDTISRIMGIPVGDPELSARLARWSTAFANLTSGYLLVQMREIEQLAEFFRVLLAEKEPSMSNDLLGAFLMEDVFQDEEDLIVNCMATFSAGRVTAQKLLGDGIPLLLPVWDEMRDVVTQDPGAALRLADELLRVVTPTRYIARYAPKDIDLSSELGGDFLIRKGETVFLFLEAANRDPERFACPHQLDRNRRPNPHIAFGYGTHRCPGASVARLEIKIALEVLFETFTEIRLDPSVPPEWDPNPNIGGFTSVRCFCA